MDKKLTVWVDNSPGGIEWTLGLHQMAHVYANESSTFTKATLIIHTTPKKASKKKKRK